MADLKNQAEITGELRTLAKQIAFYGLDAVIGAHEKLKFLKNKFDVANGNLEKMTYIYNDLCKYVNSKRASTNNKLLTKAIVDMFEFAFEDAYSKLTAENYHDKDYIQRLRAHAISIFDDPIKELIYTIYPETRPAYDTRMKGFSYYQNIVPKVKLNFNS